MKILKNKNLWSLIILIGLIGIQSFSQSSNTPETKMKSGFSGFRKNAGQIIDQDSKLNPSVKYLLSENNFKVQLKDKSFSYELISFENSVESSTAANNHQIKINSHRIDVELINSNIAPILSAEDQKQEIENYYNIPNHESVLGVRSYGKVTYKNIYDGIDLVFYSNREHKTVKYEFIVNPGANPDMIRLKYNGQNTLSMNENGSMSVSTSFGNLIEDKLIAFTLNKNNQKSNVEINFNLDNDILSFNCSDYDKNSTLVIDPFLIWSTYYGGTSTLDEEARHATSDASGAIILCGFTQSTGNIATTGAHQTTYGGSWYDGFLAKFNNDGTMNWATYYGGSNDDQAFGVYSDGSSIVMAGSTRSNDAGAIATPGAFQTSLAGGVDAFLVKFNSSGVRQWGTYYGSAGNEVANDVTIDGSGNIYLVGTTNSSSSIATSGASQTFNAGGNDAFLVKFNSSGARQWATYMGGSSTDEGNGICTDAGGYVYITGLTSSSSNIATSGAHQTSFGGGSNDGYLVKYASSGALQWGTYYGGNDYDDGKKIIYNNGDIYFTGMTKSNSAIATAGVYQSNIGGIEDAYVARFNSSGARQWGTYFGGSSIDEAWDICSDSKNNIIITGFTSSSDGIASNFVQQSDLDGGRDAFIAKFTSSGNITWSSYYGGSGDDYGYGTAIDPLDNIFIAGVTGSNNILITPGAYQSTRNGYQDVIIAKFYPIYIRIDNTPTNLCSGDVGTVSFSTIGGDFYSGNTFYVQLSDASGNFSSPVTIGSSVSTGSGNINITIPNGTAAGTGYRMRIVCTSPSITSKPSSTDIMISVKPILPPASTFGSNSVCTQSVATYSSTQPGNATNTWFINGGAPSTGSGNSITVSWGAAGTGTVKLIQTVNGSGCKDSATLNVTINPKPNPSISGSTLVCPNSTMSYSTPNISGDTYQWFVTYGIVSGPSTNPNVDIIWDAAGNGVVKVVETSSLGCSNTTTQIVSIAPPLNTDFNGNLSVCANSYKTYTSTIPAGTINKWTVSSGNSIVGADDQADVVIHWGTNNPGTLTLIQTFTNAGCKDTAIKTININPIPNPVISGNQQVCAKSVVNYQVTTPGTETNQWIVTGGSPTSGTGNNLNITWGTGSNGTIKVIQTNSFGCADTTALYNVTINPLPNVDFTGSLLACANNISTFNAVVTSGVTNVWINSAGTVIGGSTGNSFQVQWGTQGTQTIKLIQTTTNGCKDSVVKNVTINALPTPSVSGSTFTCKNSVEVYQTPFAAGIANNWSVSGGTQQGGNTGNSFTVLWDNAGSGNVKLIQTNSSTGCADSSTYPVTINPLPTLDLIGNTTICEHSTINYTTTVVSGISNHWILSGGTTSDDPYGSSINVVWGNAGAGTIKLVKTILSSTCKDSITQNVSINPLPTPSIVPTTAVCYNSTVNYSAVTPSGTSNSWTVLGGNIQGGNTGSSIQVKWDISVASGTIILYQTINSSGCFASDTKIISINPLPQPIVTGNQNVCANTTASYKANTPSNILNLWSVSSNGTINGSNNGDSITVTWNTSGAGFVNLVQTNAVTSCKDSTSYTITVNPLPVVNISGNISVCEYSNVNYSANTGSGISYLWHISGGSIVGDSTLSNVSINWSGQGTGSIVLNETYTSTQCTNSQTKSVTINPLPVPVITGSPFSVCEKSTAVYNANSGSGINYQWTAIGGAISGSSNQQNVTIIWGNQGSGTLTLTETYSSTNCTSTSSQTIIINPLPVISINGNNLVCAHNYQTYFTSHGANIVNNWDASGGTIQGSKTSDTIRILWNNQGIGKVYLEQTNSVTSCKSSDSINVSVNSLPSPSISGSPSVCNNNTYNYNATTPVGTTNQWIIVPLTGNGAIQGSSTASSINILWNTNGTVKLKLYQTISSSGCIDSNEITITVNPLPNPTIQGNNPVCSNNIEKYWANTTVGTTNIWTVSSGGTAQTPLTGDTIRVLWGAAGTGTVSLAQTITNTACTFSDTKLITINPLPSPVINGSVSVCENSAQYYWANTPGNTNNVWKIEAGTGTITPVNSSTISILWGTAGTAKLKLYQTITGTGCNDSSSINLNVNPIPLPDIQGDLSVCEKNIETYWANTPVGTTNLWTISTGSGTVIGSSTSASFTVKWGNSGSAQITLKQTKTSSLCENSQAKTITINPLPQPSIQGNPSVCEQNVEVYWANTPLGISNQWTIAHGSIIGGSTSSSFTVKWNSACTDTIKLIQTNLTSLCKDSSFRILTINPLPQPTITGNPSVCSNNIESYSVSTPVGMLNQWSVSSGTIIGSSTGTAINVLWGQTGSGKVLISQINSTTLCSNTTSMDVIINGLPDPQISGGSLNVCENNYVQYNANTPANTKNKWNVKGGIISGSDSSNTVNVLWGTAGSGTITLKQTISVSGCNLTKTDLINIRPLPKPVINGKLSVCEKNVSMFYANAPLGIANFWRANGGNIIGDPTRDTINITWAANGTGKVTLIQTDQVSLCVDSANQNVIINSLPSPDIQGANAVCAENPVAYTTPVLSNISNSWSVIQGGTQIGSSNSNTFLVSWGPAGTGKLKLIQKNLVTGCEDSVNKDVVIYDLPKVTIVGSDTACLNESKQYSADTPSGTSNDWKIVGGIIDNSHAAIINVVWNTVGTGTLTLTQTKAYPLSSCQGQNTFKVIINPLPSPHISGKVDVCANSAEQYSAITPSGTKNIWNVIGANKIDNSDSSKISVTWSDNYTKGQVLLTQIIASTGCSKDTVIEVNINKLPNPVIKGDTVVCENKIINYTANTPNGIFNEWIVDGGQMIGNKNDNQISVNWNKSGSGTVTLIQTNQTTLCNKKVSSSVWIQPLPIPSITGSKSVCENSTEVYDSKSTYETNKWTVTGGVIIGSDASPSISIKWNNYGIGKIILKQTNLAGCDSTISFDIIINPLPKSDFTGTVQVCQKSIENYKSTLDKDINNKWTVTGGSIIGNDNGPDLQVKWTNLGNDTVRLEKINSVTGCKDVSYQIIKVMPLPNPEVMGDSSVCINEIYKYTSDKNPDVSDSWQVIGGDELDKSDPRGRTIKWTGTQGIIVLTQKNNSTGCLDSIVKNIKINPLPDPSIQGNLEVCENSIEKYQSNADTNIINKWIITGADVLGSETAANVIVKWNNSGQASVKLNQINKLTGCANSKEWAVTVHLLPKKGIYGKNIICENNVTDYTSDLESGSTQEWEITGGQIINSNKKDLNINVLWGKAGIGKVTLFRTSSFGCKDTNFYQVNLNPQPKAQIIGDSIVATLNPVKFASKNYSNLENKWFVDPNAIINGSSTDSIVSVTWNSVGSGAVSLVQTNTNTGCQDTTIFLIKIVEVSATLRIGSAQAKPGDIVSIPIYYSKNDTINLLNHGVSGFKAKLSFKTSILDPIDGTPQGNIIGDQRVLDLDMKVSSNPKDTVLQVLKFEAMLGEATGTNLELTDVQTQGVLIALKHSSGTFSLLGVCHEGGLRLVTISGKFELMAPKPNPSSNAVKLEFSSPENGMTQLFIMNSVGQQVKSIINKEVVHGTYEVDIPVSDLPSGIYFITLKTPTRNKTVKLEVTK
ncbi:MAG: SBBP repeat-containing protein [Candidatus Kapabacteria bacterium]|nr:SBBP repeat-containing protein [Candidatus Kapabacteria bacterium]